MHRPTTYAVGASVLALVVVTWIVWAGHSEGEWKSFESLGVLFTGLAFAGLVFTIAIQLNELRDQKRSTQESLIAVRQQAESLSLYSLRMFIGGEIAHLNDLLGDQDGARLKAEGLSREDAERRVAEWKEVLPGIGRRLHRLALDDRGGDVRGDREERSRLDD